MSWLQLLFDSDAGHAPALEEVLLDVGALSVTLQPLQQDGAAEELVLEPGVGETPLWQATRVVALFGAETDPAATIAALQQQLPVLPPWRAETLADQVWERAWMADFQPLRFGRRLWVCPSWCTAPDPEAVVLSLDPGLAFGTGTHPTTALCLEWLDAQPLQGCTVLDYGCGSGILAIAALLLGADRALAVDNDPQALAASRDNAGRNGIAPQRLLTYLPDQLPRNSIADVTVANILAGPLQTLAPTLARHTAAGGRLALSGILAAQGEAVAAAYRPWFEVAAPVSRGEWLRLDAVKTR